MVSGQSHNRQGSGVKPFRSRFASPQEEALDLGEKEELKERVCVMTYGQGWVAQRRMGRESRRRSGHAIIHLVCACMGCEGARGGGLKCDGGEDEGRRANKPMRSAGNAYAWHTSGRGRRLWYGVVVLVAATRWCRYSSCCFSLCVFLCPSLAWKWSIKRRSVCVCEFEERRGDF